MLGLYFMGLFSLFLMTILYSTTKLFEYKKLNSLLVSTLVFIFSILMFKAMLNTLNLILVALLSLLISIIFSLLNVTNKLSLFIWTIKSFYLFTLAYSFILSLFELLTKQNYYHAITEVPAIIFILFLCSIFLFLSLEVYSLLHLSEDSLTYLLRGTPALIPTILIILLLVKKLSFFYVLMYSKHSYAVSLTIFIALILELFFSYYFLSLIKKSYHFSIYKYKQKILTMQYELELSNYHQLEHHQLNLRKIAHDLHNHNIILRDLIKQNNPEQALSYLDEYATQMTATQISQLTGHKILNALLVKKQQQCLQHNIQFTPQIKLPPQLHLSDFDLCILIGNLLDNAIEATVNLSSESLRIDMQAKIINDNLIFQIINPYTGHLIKKNGGFSTSKIDKLNHGLGLLNVDHVIKKYDGIIDFSYDQETFSATLRFPIPTNL